LEFLFQKLQLSYSTAQLKSINAIGLNSLALVGVPPTSRNSFIVKDIGGDANKSVAGTEYPAKLKPDYKMLRRFTFNWR
jgi:hypothetical protein